MGLPGARGTRADGVPVEDAHTGTALGLMPRPRAAPLPPWAFLPAYEELLKYHVLSFTTLKMWQPSDSPVGLLI